MTALIPGQRVPVSGTSPALRIVTGDEALFGRRFSVLIVFLDAQERAALPPVYAHDAATHVPALGFREGFAIDVHLDRLPASVARVQLIGYVVGGPGSGASFKDLQRLRLEIGDDVFDIDLVSCGYATLHLVDFYRHNGAWRMLANAQGFTGGLGVVGSRIGAALDSNHGVPEAARDPDSGRESGRDSGPPPPPGSGGSGSGFAIARNHILTNHHVVEHGREIEVASERRAGTGRVVFSDPVNDLALVETDLVFDQTACFRAALDLHLGEDVVLIGFPLQGLLGQGPQVTTGNVSGLCGFSNNSAMLQYTAPTASGSSGGPILDASGLVIGVVCAGLAHDVLRSRGSLSENINFGVKGVVARAFLAAAGITADARDDGRTLSRAEIARAGRAYAALLKVRY